ncbi:helix-turn-helix domain-containing protein [Streptomyces rochei]|uniref:helix-turn-helix domain-containing protein n=1 Tax=Streptomyces rochei TaxID=1928 RepID=UPI002ACDA24D|nr:helix-turn-helix domain-containing protein [Streptomyces rochei]WQC16511.1 helix-turn-helix domain-containing protein [Streptomyces rochei]
MRNANLPSRPPHWGRPKLTPHQRDEIRQRLAHGEDPADLAAEYGVSAGTIRAYR